MARLFSLPSILRNKRFSRGEEGGSLIETAVSFTAIFTLFFCFMETCLAFYSQHMISESAREGARYAMVHGATCTTSSGSSCTASATQINSFVSGIAWPNVAGGTITPATTYPDGDEAVGHHVQVQVTYSFTVTMPLVPRRTFTLVSTSKVPILQ